MKYLLILLLLACFLYLNRSYSYFYSYLTNHSQNNPNRTYYVINDNSTLASAKYIALGDSLLAGVGSSNYQSSIAYLIAQKISTQQRVVLLNLAKPGAKAYDVVANQMPQAISERPDLVVVLVGINDIHNFTSENDFESYYRQIVDQLTLKTSAKITLINIPYLGSSLILLPPWDILMDQRTKQFNQAIERITKGRGVKLIDLYSLTRKNFEKPSDLYSNDQFHPSNKGYTLWMELINAN